METKVEKLDGSRVRVDVGIDPDEVEERVKEAATRLGQEMKISGFREGKVPPEMVLQKVGREAVLSEALEGSLGDWNERAMIDAAVSPVGDPKLDLTELPEQGKPLEFAIEVNVLPVATLGEY
jgi:trigger factor